MAITGKVTEILLDADKIQARVKGLAEEITEDYQDKEIFGICLLKGSMIFAADLIRHIPLAVTVDTMRASSYDGKTTASAGSVKVLHDLDKDISGLDVLIIEDIVDTGRTLSKIIALLQSRHPASIKVCSLLDKPSRRVEDVPIHYRGFTIEDHFVVGYGLDYDDYYRNLPHIGILDPNA